MYKFFCPLCAGIIYRDEQTGVYKCPDCFAAYAPWYIVDRIKLFTTRLVRMARKLKAA